MKRHRILTPYLVSGFAKSFYRRLFKFSLIAVTPRKRYWRVPWFYQDREQRRESRFLFQVSSLVYFMRSNYTFQDDQNAELGMIAYTWKTILLHDKSQVICILNRALAIFRWITGITSQWIGFTVVKELPQFLWINFFRSFLIHYLSPRTYCFPKKENYKNRNQIGKLQR